MSFRRGFTKVALQKDRKLEDLSVAGTSLMPFGRELHSAYRKGREGKRWGDYGARLGGSIAGSLPGQLLARHAIKSGKFKSLPAALALTLGGAAAGEIIADRLRTSDNYKKGKLKK